MYYSHLILLALAATPARKAIECGRINDRTMYSNTDTPVSNCPPGSVLYLRVAVVSTNL